MRADKVDGYGPVMVVNCASAQNSQRLGQRRPMLKSSQQGAETRGARERCKCCWGRRGRSCAGLRRPKRKTDRNKDTSIHIYIYIL